MARFRTKPFEIEAIQFSSPEDYPFVSEFCGGDKFRKNHDGIYQVYDYLHETWVGVKIGQWIIKGQKGEFYPCDPEIFEAKYERVV